MEELFCLTLKIKKNELSFQKIRNQTEYNRKYKRLKVYFSYVRGYSSFSISPHGWHWLGAGITSESCYSHPLYCYSHFVSIIFFILNIQWNCIFIAFFSPLYYNKNIILLYILHNEIILTLHVYEKLQRE